MIIDKGFEHQFGDSHVWKQIVGDTEVMWLLRDSSSSEKMESDDNSWCLSDYDKSAILETHMKKTTKFFKDKEAYVWIENGEYEKIHF